MERRTSKTIRAEDGPETVSKLQVQWVHPNDVSLDLYRTGEPTDDAFVESFNGSLFEK
jgi:putative transposase